MTAELPIKAVLSEIKAKLLRGGNVVVVAPPGAGKTTQVPLALLGEDWLGVQRILMLEPRRIAARSAARYMARLLGETVGATVGYRVRLDTRVSAATKIEVVTEGVLTRMLQADPALDGVGLIIFDEFHERSLQADLGLALCLQTQAFLRDDLRLMVMSATLDVQPAAALLNNAPVIISEGRSYPVETIYSPPGPGVTLETAVTAATLTAFAQSNGDILVFLPGIGEIRRIAARLAQHTWGDNIKTAVLHGGMSHAEQDAALQPAPGIRKIVLATAIAETSLTVEGIQAVVDSGLMRVPKFSPRTGLTHLATVKVSLAVAEQRRGRAGRLGPGICLRLWSKQDERGFSQHSTPEICEADLAPLALELAAWGVTAPEELSWLNCPPSGAFAQARALLLQLGAVDDSGRITAAGRSMAALGYQPRLAHMLLKSISLGLGPLACEVAAVLNERDILRCTDADLQLRIEAVRRMNDNRRQAERFGENGMDLTVYQQIRKEITFLKRSLKISSKNDSHGNSEACGLLVALAYPDRIAQRREPGRFLLQNGRGAKMDSWQALANEQYIVAVELDDKGSESHIFRAAAIDSATLLQHFAGLIEQDTQVFWDRPGQLVRGRCSWRLGAITLKEVPLAKPPPEAVFAALMTGISLEGLEILPWTKAARQFQARVNFLHHFDGSGWPDLSDQALLARLTDWLGPYAGGITGKAGLQQVNLAAILEGVFSWEERREIDRLAPSHLVVPSGQRIGLDYSQPEKPVLAVRLQEVFGLTETPAIAGGRVPLTLHLLSPAYRPVQITTDLASFWQQAYYAVKRDLQGRYPRHYWPDDPLQAVATNRAKQRR